MPGFAKTPLPLKEARAYLEESATNASKLAGLVNIASFAPPFAIAPISARPDELIAFDSGKRWSQREADDALERIAAEEFHGPWWGVYQNVHSMRGDLPADEFLGDHVFVDDCYIHICSQPRKLDLDVRFGNAVGFLRFVFLTTLSPSVYSSENASTLSPQTAQSLADSIFCVAVSAYDDESWIVARKS